MQLARRPEAITLDQIHGAVDTEAGVFALRTGGNPHCPVNARMQDLLAPIFENTNQAVQATLRQTTLASLVGAIV